MRGTAITMCHPSWPAMNVGRCTRRTTAFNSTCGDTTEPHRTAPRWMSFQWIRCVSFTRPLNKIEPKISCSMRTSNFSWTTRCVPCGKSFPRKQELSRHFHLNHSSEWHECFQRAMNMDNRWKPQYGCICQPRQHTKHVCTFYIQFILLRLEHERQLLPQIAPLPPDLVLSPTEQVEPLLWLGCAHLLYDKPELRLALTRICQICGHNCREGDELHRQLHAAHPAHVEDIQSFKEMFQWSLFQEQGCFCNPSPGWGHPNHECVGIIQLAWIAHSFNWQVVLPWSYGSH